MFQKADLTVKEVRPPHGLWCRSGHKAPPSFRRDGPLGKELPTRFFQVSSDKAPSVNGTYCEPCLIVANAMNRNEVGAAR